MQTHKPTYINPYFTPLNGHSSLIDEEIDGKLQCPSWWMTSFGPMCWSRTPNQRPAHPAPPSSFAPFLLTIDQWKFSPSALFDFNAWGGRSSRRGFLLARPGPSTIHLYLGGWGGVWAMTDPVALCLFILISRQSLCVKWSVCFQTDYCLHMFNYSGGGGVLNREMLQRGI